MLENTTILHFVLLHQVPEHPTTPVGLVHLPPLLLCWVRLYYQRFQKYIFNSYSGVIQ